MSGLFRFALILQEIQNTVSYRIGCGEETVLTAKLVIFLRIADKTHLQQEAWTGGVAVDKIVTVIGSAKVAACVLGQSGQNILRKVAGNVLIVIDLAALGFQVIGAAAYGVAVE